MRIERDPDYTRAADLRYPRKMESRTVGLIDEKEATSKAQIPTVAYDSLRCLGVLKIVKQRTPMITICLPQHL